MGQGSSSAKQHDDTVDVGALVPHGVYTSQQDWNQAVVTQLIIERKLAPFYRPLEDYDESWDDDRILAARKEFPSETTPPPTAGSDGATAHTVPPPPPPSQQSHHRHAKHHSRVALGKDPQRFSEAAIYRGAVECPICFMYYPPNINRSRCCDQEICTECFVQIKRADPTATHLVSEPAACPYCVQENFGVVYQPPPWRAGIGGENGGVLPSRPELSKANSASSADAEISAGRGKRRSISHTSREVVTIDQIRPDWEAKLAAVRAAVTRRANRRIIMRQVGDRLIPVGVTSGRVHALPGEGGAETPPNGEESSRPGGRRRNQDLTQLLGNMGLGGQDIEELMIMEAMRLSMIDHEEHQRKEAAARNNANSGAQASGAGSSSASAPMAIPSAGRSPSPFPASAPSSSSHMPPRMGAMSSAIGRAAVTTALAIGFPSSHLSALNNASSPQLIEPPSPSHRRTESSPPPLGSPTATFGAVTSAALLAVGMPSSFDGDASSAMRRATPAPSPLSATVDLPNESADGAAPAPTVAISHASSGWSARLDMPPSPSAMNAEIPDTNAQSSTPSESSAGHVVTPDAAPVSASGDAGSKALHTGASLEHPVECAHDGGAGAVQAH